MSKYVYLQVTCGGSINVYVTDVLVSFEFDLLRLQPYWFALYQKKTRIEREKKTSCLVTKCTFLPHMLASFMTSQAKAVRHTMVALRASYVFATFNR